MFQCLQVANKRALAVDCWLRVAYITLHSASVCDWEVLYFSQTFCCRYWQLVMSVTWRCCHGMQRVRKCDAGKAPNFGNYSGELSSLIPKPLLSFLVSFFILQNYAVLFLFTWEKLSETSLRVSLIFLYPFSYFFYLLPRQSNQRARATL